MAPERLLVYRPGAIGDFILALPALAALRARFPGAMLVAVGPAAAIPLAQSSGLADLTLAADDPRLAPYFVPDASALPPLVTPEATPWTPAAGPTGLGDAPPAPASPFTHAVLWAGATGETLAANLRAHGVAVVHAPSRPPPGRRQHVADYLVETLAPLDVDRTEPAVPCVWPSPAATARAAAFLVGHETAAPARRSKAQSGSPVDAGLVSGHGGDPGGAAGHPPTRWVALHVGSGSPRKNWPPEQFAAVADSLAVQGFRLLLLAGPAEAEGESDVVATVMGAIRGGPPVVVRDWPLDALAALLARCAGYVGGDSGITHLAAAVGAPVVAVFGPTDPAVWAPRGPRVTIVRNPVPCQPCTWEAMWACPHRACLTALPADAVLATAELAFGPPAPRAMATGAPAARGRAESRPESRLGDSRLSGS